MYSQLDHKPFLLATLFLALASPATSMCRWITLISSKPVTLSDLVLTPSNSLIHQSRDASFHPGYDESNNAVMNGDGFGLGWYHTNPSIVQGEANYDGASGTITSFNRKKQTGTSAAVFRDTFPAWNNANLRELCTATASSCIMAHVRAASRGTGISHQNCHPFKAGRLLFCHNGRLWQFSKMKRQFMGFVSDDAFKSIHGTTDSEIIFAMILTFLAKDGKGSPFEQKEPFGEIRLVRALKKTLRQIETIMEESGITDGYSTFNFSLVDGETIVATRFCDKEDISPPSLYFAYGEAGEIYKELVDQDNAAPVSAAHRLSKASSTLSNVSFDDSEKKTGDDASSTASSELAEEKVDIEDTEIKAGTVLVDIDPTSASCIISSNPLTTKIHKWNKMPRNSIMWCTRGKHPELRLLTKKRNRTYTISNIALQ